MKKDLELSSENKMPSEKLYREFQNLERKIQLLVNENRRLQDELSQSVSENQILKSKDGEPTSSPKFISGSDKNE